MGSLGLKIQLENKNAVKTEYFDFIKELNNQKINLGINFDSNIINNIKTQIETIQKQIGNNPVEIKIDNNKLNKQLDDVKKKLEKAGNEGVEIKWKQGSNSAIISYKNDIGEVVKETYKLGEVTKKVGEEVQRSIKFKKYSEDFKQDSKEIYDELNKRKREIEKLANVKANVTFKEDEKTKQISSAVITWTDNVGKLQKEYYKLNTAIKETNNSIIKTTSFDKTQTTFTDNIQKTTKELNNLKNELKDLQKENAKLTQGYSSNSFKDNYVKGINEVKKALNSDSVTENDINKIQQIMNLLKLENQETKNTIEWEKTRTKALNEEQTTRQKILSQQSKEKEEQKDIANIIRQTQSSMQTKVQNLNTKYRELVPQSEITKFQETLNKLNATSLKDLRIQIKDLNNEFKKLEADTKAKGSVLGQRDNQGWITTFSNQLKKFGSWYLTGGIIVGAKNAFASTVSEITNMDTALVDLSKVVDISKSQMEDMRISAISLGKGLGQSASDTVNAMAEFGRVTKNLEEIKTLSNVSGMASNVTDLKSEDAAKALNTTMISFKINAKDSMHILNSWNEIQNNFRTSAMDLADSIGAVGAAAKQSNVSLEQLEGFTTAIVSSTGMKGSEVGTALKTMISRTFRIGKDGAEDAGKTEEALKNIGVQVRNSSGDFRSFSDILVDTKSKFDGLSKAEQVHIAQQIGGTHHYSKFIALMDSFNIATDATNKAINSQGSAWQENQKYLNSVSGQFAILKTNIESIQQDVLKSDDLKLFLYLGNDITVLIQKIGSLKVVMGSLIAMILLKNKSYREWIQSEGLLTSILSNTGLGVKRLTNGMRDFIITMKISTATNGTVKGSLIGLGLGFKTLASSLNLAKIGVIAFESAITMGISFAVASAIEYIVKLVNKNKELADSVKNLMTDSKQNIQDNNSKIQQLESLSKEYDILKNKTSLTTEEQKKMHDIQNQIAQISPSVVTGYDEQGNALINMKNGVSGLIEELKKKNELENHKIASGYNDAKTNYDNQYKKEHSAMEKALKKKKELEKQLEDNERSLSSTSTNSLNANSYIKSLKEQQMDLRKELQKTNSEIDKHNSNIQDETNELNQRKNAILQDTEGYKKLSEEKKKLANIMIQPIDMTKDESEKEIKEVVNLLNDAQVEPFIKKIDDLQKKFKDGKIDSDEFNKSVYEIIKKISELSGVNLSEAQLKTFFQDLTDGANNTKKSIEEATKGVDDLQKELTGNLKNIEEYGKILNNIKEKGKLSSEDKKEIIDKNPELIQYLGDLNKLTDELNKKIEDNKLKSEGAYSTIKIKEEVESIQALKKEYEDLASRTDLSISEKERLANITQELKGKIEGLIIATDEDGKATIKNMELTDERIRVLQLEEKYLGLVASVGKDKAKDMMAAEITQTKITYKQVLERISLYEKELQALNTLSDAAGNTEDKLLAKEKAGTLTPSERTSLANMMNGGVSLGVRASSNLESLRRIKESIEQGDKDLSNSKQELGDVTDTLTDTTKKNSDVTRENSLAQKELTNTIKNAKNAMKEYENIIKSVDNVLFELDTNLKGLDTTSEEYRNGLKQEIELFKQRNSAAENAININGTLVSSIGAIGGVSGTALQQQVVAEAEKYLNVPYKWGGKSLSEGGLDCSGLISASYSKFGIDLSGSTYEQIKKGTPVAKQNLQPGDMVFFGSASDPHHVGMYIGSGNFIQAPSSGDVVKITPLDSRRDYLTARRVINGSSESGSSSASSGGGYSGKYADIINEASKKYGVPSSLIAALIKQESDFNPNDVSNQGAVGLMQLMPALQRELGVTNARDPQQNIMGGTKYLKQMLDKTGGDAKTAVGYYNCGPNGNLNNSETQNHMKKVMEYYKQNGGEEGRIETATGEIENILSKSQDLRHQVIDFNRKIQEDYTKVYESYIQQFDDKISSSINKELEMHKERFKLYEQDSGKKDDSTRQELELVWKEINNRSAVLQEKKAFIEKEMKQNIYDQKTNVMMKKSLTDVDLEITKNSNELHQSFNEWLDDRFNWSTKDINDNIEKLKQNLDLLDAKDGKGFKAEKVTYNEEIFNEQVQKRQEIEKQLDFIKKLYNKEQYGNTKELWLHQLEKYQKSLKETNIEIEKTNQIVNNLKIEKILDTVDKKLKLINDDLKDIDSREKEISDSNISSKLINSVNKASDYIAILKQDVKAYNDIYKEVSKDGVISNEEQKKLDEQHNKIIADRDNIIQLKQQLENLRLDNILAPFQNAISQITNNVSKLGYQLNMLVTTNYKGKANILNEQLGFNKTKVGNLFEEYNKLMNESAKSGSKEADELSKRLITVRDSLIQASEEGLNLKKQLQDVSLSAIFEEIDKPQRNVNQQMSNIDFTTSMGSENKGLLLGNNFIDTTDKYKTDNEKQLEETEKVSNAVDNINSKISDLSAKTYNINTSDITKAIENTTNKTNDILTNIKDSVNHINENNNKDINVKNVYGTGNDLNNAKELATLYGISNMFKFIDTNKSEYLSNRDKYKFTSNDVILGGTGAIGGIGNVELNGARRLPGEDAQDTKNKIDVYMKDILNELKGNKNAGNINDTTSNNKELISALNVNNTNSQVIATNTANDVIAVQTQTQQLTSVDATNAKTVVDTINAGTSKLDDSVKTVDNDLKTINTTITKLDTSLSNILNKLGTIDTNNTTELNEVLQELTLLHGSVNSLGNLIADTSSGEKVRYRFNETAPVSVKDTKEVDKKATGGGTTEEWNIVGEEGEEGAILPNSNKVVSIGKSGWTLQRFPKGTTVINHKDFEKVKRQGGIVETPHFAKGTKNYRVFAKSDSNKVDELYGDFENARDYVKALGRDDIKVMLYNGSQKITSDDIVLGGTTIISNSEANGAERRYGEGRQGTLEAFKAWVRNAPIKINSDDIQHSINNEQKPIPSSNDTLNNHSETSSNSNKSSTGINSDEYTKLDNTAYRQGLNASITDIQSKYTDQLQNGANDSELIQNQIELQQKSILLNNDAIKQMKEKEVLYKGNAEALKKIADEEKSLNEQMESAQKKIQDLSKAKINALFEDSDKQLKLIEEDIKKIGNIDTPEEKLQQLQDINKELGIHKKNLDIINKSEEDRYKSLDKFNNPRLNDLLSKQINGVLNGDEKTELVKIENAMSSEDKMLLLNIISELQALRDKKVNVEVDVKTHQDTIENEMKDRAKAVIEKNKAFEEAQLEQNKKIWEKQYFNIAEQEWNEYHSRKINKLQDELVEARKLEELNKGESYYKDEILAKENELASAKEESYANIKHWEDEFVKVHQTKIQALEDEKKLESDKEEKLKRQNDLLLLQKQLAEALNQKNVQQLVKTKSGWQFQYVADMGRVDSLQKEINEKKKDNDKYDKDKKIEDQKKYEEDLIRVQKEAYDKLVKQNQETIEERYKNIEYLTDTFLQDLKLKFGNDSKRIMESLTSSLNTSTEKSNLFIGDTQSKMKNVLDLLTDLINDAGNGSSNGKLTDKSYSVEDFVKKAKEYADTGSIDARQSALDMVDSNNKSPELSRLWGNMFSTDVAKQTEAKRMIAKYFPTDGDLDDFWNKFSGKTPIPQQKTITKEELEKTEEYKKVVKDYEDAFLSGDVAKVDKVKSDWKKTAKKLGYDYDYKDGKNPNAQHSGNNNSSNKINDGFSKEMPKYNYTPSSTSTNNERVHIPSKAEVLGALDFNKSNNGTTAMIDSNGHISYFNNNPMKEYPDLTKGYTKINEEFVKNNLSKYGETTKDYSDEYTMKLFEAKIGTIMRDRNGNLISHMAESAWNGSYAANPELIIALQQNPKLKEQLNLTDSEIRRAKESYDMQTPEWKESVSKLNYSSFDTGGETGNWSNNEGKFAMLHQKERVLDVSQTEGFNNLVFKQLPELKNVLPKLINTIQLPNLDFKLPNLSGILNSQSKETIIHNHIDKLEFPGVSNGQEVVDTLKNLPNFTRQYVREN